MVSEKKYLVVVTGPTAVGKTAFAIKLAQYFNTEIISADSRQFYREMQIGTAYPEPEELAAAQHHFVGNLSLSDAYNVSRYESEVMTLLSTLYEKYQMVILTGGSGLYIDAVCKGIDDLPDHDPELRDRLKQELNEIGIEAFGLKLKTLDPEYYEVIDRLNPNRLLRAVEVCIQTGNTYTSLRKNLAKPRPFEMIKIGLNLERDDLFSRIGDRVDSMMAKGLLDEVRTLMPFRGYNALNTVGYKELFMHLDGDYTIDEAIEKIKTNTRRYAKRQLTWFKREENMKWFSPDNIEKAINFINSNIHN